MKVLVCGGRDFTNRAFVCAKLDAVHARRPIRLLISGHARGADTLGEEWAASRGIHCAVVAALWHVHGNKAGPLRNGAMRTLGPDLVIAFPGGTGTAHMVSISQAIGIPVWQPTP